MSISFDDLGRALSISEVARRLGRDRATVHSWVGNGVRGVRLRTIVVGGRRYCLPEFVEEFVAKLSAPSNVAAAEPDRRSEIAAAEDQLDALLG